MVRQVVRHIFGISFELIGNYLLIINKRSVGLIDLRLVVLLLWRRRNFEFRNVVFVLLDVVVAAEEGVGLRVNVWQYIKRIIVMGNTDVVIKDVETIVVILSDPGLLLVLLFVVLVDYFLDDLVDVGIKVNIHLFWLNDRPNGICWLALFFIVVLNSL